MSGVSYLKSAAKLTTQLPSILHRALKGEL